MWRSHFMGTGKRIIFALALLALAAAVILWPATRPRPPLNVSVSFAGYTNDITGARLATFRVSNNSRVIIRRWGVFHPESKQQPRLLRTLNCGPAASLAPGQSEVIAVPTPTNQQPWRAVFDCTEYGLKMKIQDKIGPIGDGGLISRFRLYRLWLTPVQFVRSGWIED